MSVMRVTAVSWSLLAKHRHSTHQPRVKTVFLAFSCVTPDNRSCVQPVGVMKEKAAQAGG